MKRLITTLSFIALSMLPVHAGKLSVPFTVTANGTDQAAVAITGIAPSVTNWVSLSAILVTVPTNCAGSFTLSCGIGGYSVEMSSTTFVNASTNSNALKLYMPRRSVWASSNPAVDVMPILGTNCTVYVKQTVTSTNVWAFTMLVEE